jgi:general secretion pathway protein J
MSRRCELQTAERGFTMVELLVAITLLGLLMAALFGGLRLGTRVWERADVRLEAAIRLQIIQDFIRQRLAEMLPRQTMPPKPDEVGVSEPLFLGTASAVRFASVMPEHLGAGFYIMELAWAESDHPEDSGNLVLRWRPFELNGQPAEDVEPEERMLIQGVQALELSYFGSIDPEQPPGWWQAWESQPELPRLIRLQMRFAENDQRRWPELIVRTMVDGAPNFDF